MQAGEQFYGAGSYTANNSAPAPTHGEPTNTGAGLAGTMGTASGGLAPVGNTSGGLSMGNASSNGAGRDFNMGYLNTGHQNAHAQHALWIDVALLPTCCCPSERLGTLFGPMFPKRMCPGCWVLKDDLSPGLLQLRVSVTVTGVSHLS